MYDNKRFVIAIMQASIYSLIYNLQKTTLFLEKRSCFLDCFLIDNQIIAYYNFKE